MKSHFMAILSKSEQNAATKSMKEDKKYFVINVRNQEEHLPKGLSRSDKTNTMLLPSSDSNSAVYIVVIAHPDDESMFFLPTITSLQKAGATVWILCLTTGNYDGLGDIRKTELSHLCRCVLGVKLIHLDVAEIQDHPNNAWPLELVAKELERGIRIALRSSSTPTPKQQQQQQQQQQQYDNVILITFDTDGVSGHCNHRDTYLAVRLLILQQQLQNIKASKSSTGSRLPTLEAWKLDTVHFLPFKYLPLVGWCLCLLNLLKLWQPTCAILPSQKKARTSGINENDESSTLLATPSSTVQAVVYRSTNPRLSWKAMATHHSQFVWYRRLFVIFSCYTFVNTLRPIQL